MPRRTKLDKLTLIHADNREQTIECGSMSLVTGANKRAHVKTSRVPPDGWWTDSEYVVGSLHDEVLVNRRVRGTKRCSGTGYFYIEPDV